jgi:hypothetical protein
MINGFNVGGAIKETIKKIMRIDNLPLTLCTNSKSLFECLVKLSTMQEKSLIIDILSLHQSYKQREIAEVIWIKGNSNLADGITKVHPCQALQDLIDHNKIDLKTARWVEKKEGKEKIVKVGGG